MNGINADGWLAVHHVEHRELIEKAKSAARHAALDEGRTPVPVGAAVPVSAAPACC